MPDAHLRTVSISPPADRLALDPLPFRERVLPNGLRAITLEDHRSATVAINAAYRVGGKDDPPGRSGFAHLFEHLMFKGSAHVGPDEHSRIIEAVGGFDNAYTSFDVTVFWETFPSNYLERVLWLEADRLGSLNVDEANFASEREVVKEERRVRYENAPYGLVEEDLYAAAFTVHPYRHLPIGSMEDLNKASVADVQDFFRTYYRPENATLVIVGDFTPTEAIRWTEKYFGGIPRGVTPVPRVTLEEPPQHQERRLAKSYGSNSPLPAVVTGYRMPGICQPDYYPLMLASNVLSQGESSRLYRKLVYEDRIALQAAGFPLFTEDSNLFWALAVMNQGHIAAEGEKAIDAELEKMKNEPVNPSELEKAKNQVIADFILGRRTAEQKASPIGSAAALCNAPERVNTDLDRYRAATAADIQRVTREYLVPERRTVLIVQPPAEPGRK
jgi:zinc protease